MGLLLLPFLNTAKTLGTSLTAKEGWLVIIAIKIPSFDVVGCLVEKNIINNKINPDDRHPQAG